MERPKFSVKVKRQAEKITLISAGGLLQVNEAVCRLCVLLAISPCAEVPCSIFVRPFYQQLCWDAAGRVAECTNQSTSLPIWPLQVFRPIHIDQEESLLLATRVLGVDSLANQSLAGFRPNEDLLLLLNQKLLQIRTKHSQLVMSIDDDIKLDIQNVLDSLDRLIANRELWELCLSSVSMPYAEPLWMFDYELLYPLFSSHVLRSFTHIDEDNPNRHIYRETAIDEKTIVRALCAFCSASINDTQCLLDMASSDFILKASTDEGSAFWWLSKFASTLAKLITVIYSSRMMFTQMDSDTALPKQLEHAVRELLFDHFPQGHLAIMGLCRELYNGGDTISNTGFRIRISELITHSLRERGLRRDLDTFLEAAVCSNASFTSLIDSEYLFFLLDEPIEAGAHQFVLRKVTSQLGVAFYRSILKDYAGALAIILPLSEFLQQQLQIDVQMFLVVICELFRCLNATGQEDCALELLPDVVRTILNSHFVHHSVHVYPTSWSPLSEIGVILVSGKEVDISLAASPACHLCRQRILEVYTAHSKIRVKEMLGLGAQRTQTSSQKVGKESRSVARQGHLTQGFRSRPFGRARMGLVQANFEVLTDFKVMLSDSYIGKGDYDTAEKILRTIYSSIVHDKERQCLSVMRLSAIMRRQVTSPLDDNEYTELVQTMSKAPNDVSIEMWSYCMDEIESVMFSHPNLLQGPAGSNLAVAKALTSLAESVPEIYNTEDVNQRLHFLEEQTEPLLVIGSSVKVNRGGLDASKRESQQSEASESTSSDSVVDDYLYSCASKTRDLVPLTGRYEVDNVAELFRSLGITLDSPMDLMPGPILDEALIIVFKHCLRFADPEPLELDAIKTLHNLGANINVKLGVHETTLLHLASDSNAEELAVLLVQLGADLEARDTKGNTPLHAAAMASCEKSVVILLQAGANYNYRNYFLETPLHTAAMTSWQEGIALLLQADADVNAVDVYGQTPAHVATSREVMRMLLKAGTDIFLRDGLQDVTPMQKAVFLECVSSYLEVARRFSGVQVLNEDVKLWIQMKGKFQETVQTPLEYATRYQCHWLTNWLTNRGGWVHDIDTGDLVYEETCRFEQRHELDGPEMYEIPRRDQKARVRSHGNPAPEVHRIALSRDDRIALTQIRQPLP